MRRIMQWLGTLIPRRNKKKPITIKQQISKEQTNNSQTFKTMARKTVISKVLPAKAEDGIIEAPNNKTLYADQFTEEPPLNDEQRAGFKAKNMKEVFEHYQPQKGGVALETEDGGSVYENFEFKSVKDFEDEQLINQSPLLTKEQEKIDAFNSVIRQLEKNKSLRSTLKDASARSNLKNSLQALLAELEEAE